MARLKLVPFTTDAAFYGALKVNVFATVWDTVLKGMSGGNTAPITASNNGIELHIGRFTARKANNLFVPEGTRATSSAEFFGFTSHKVREKLSELAIKGTVELVGRGLRDAQTYEWKEPIEKFQLCSYLRFRRATDKDPSLALDNYRMLLTFGEDPFTVREFVEAYRVVHEEEYSASRWGKRKFEEIAGSFQYQTFLKNRLKALSDQRLVAFDKPKEAFRLTPEATDAAHHFGLFLENVAYKASWEMCVKCPARSLCWDLQVTDLVLDALRGRTNGATGANGAPEDGPMTHGSNGAR